MFPTPSADTLGRTSAAWKYKDSMSNRLHPPTVCGCPCAHAADEGLERQATVPCDSCAAVGLKPSLNSTCTALPPCRPAAVPLSHSPVPQRAAPPTASALATSPPTARRGGLPTTCTAVSSWTLPYWPPLRWDRSATPYHVRNVGILLCAAEPYTQVWTRDQSSCCLVPQVEPLTRNKCNNGVGNGNDKNKAKSRKYKRQQRMLLTNGQQHDGGNDNGKKKCAEEDFPSDVCRTK